MSRGIEDDVEPLGRSVGPWRYYLIAVLAPALFVAAVILIDVGAGLGRFVSSGSLVFTVAAVLVVGGVASLPLTIGEEYGWRGYLLPRLLPLGEMKATVILAAIWGIWHMPILLIGLKILDSRYGQCSQRLSPLLH